MSPRVVWIMQELGRSSFLFLTRSVEDVPEGFMVKGFSLNISRSDFDIFVSLVNM